jgi:alanine racemase
LGELGAKVATAARRGRPSLFSVETLANAYELRTAGKDWHRIGLLLGVPQGQIHSAVRQACRTGISQRLAG